MAVGILEYLVSTNTEIDALLLHPRDDSQYVAKEDAALIKLVDDAVIVRGDEFRDNPELSRIAETNPDFLINVGYGYIFRDTDLLKLPTKRAINVHTSLLPWNRGRHTAPWTIINGDPAGVTIHVMNESIDDGAIIAQTSVEYDLTDTPGTLYQRLYRKGVQLFIEAWPNVRDGTIELTPQDGNRSTYNSAEELSEFGAKLQSETFSPVEFVRAVQGLGGQVTLSLDDTQYIVSIDVVKDSS